MPARKVRDEGDARALLEEASRSGESRVEWCRSAGVNARSLNAWRLNLARRGASRPVPSPVHLVELVVAKATVPVAAPVVRIRHGSFVIEVEEGASPEALRGVLWAVGRC